MADEDGRTSSESCRPESVSAGREAVEVAGVSGLTGKAAASSDTSTGGLTLEQVTLTRRPRCDLDNLLKDIRKARTD